MIIVFIGVSRRSGTSKKTGNPYDMCQLTFAVPVQPVNSPSMQLEGYGFEAKEIDIQPEAMEQFCDIPPFHQVDVIIEPKPTNFNQTWIVGMKPANPKK